MRINDYTTSLQDRIAELTKLAKNTYDKLTTSNNTTYEYHQQIDELSEQIIRIMFYKKQLFRIVNIEDEPEEIPTREEYTKLRHQRLLIDKTMYEEQLNIVDKAIESIKDNKKLNRLVNKLEMEKFRIQTSIGEVLSNLRIYEQKPDLTDGEIDIYLNQNQGDVAFRGYIYLHNTSIEVGQIDYRGPCDSKWLGDIGYTIREEHRGNNYAYKALQLISPVIASNDVEKVTITTYAENIASVKTIEKFGGVLTDTINQDVLSYICEITPTLKQTPKKDR